MFRQDIARLAFVMAGIYALLEAVEYVSTFLYWLFIGEEFRDGYTRTDLIMGYLPPGLILAAMGVSLIIFSRNLSVRLFPGAAPSPDRILAFPAVAYSVVGLVCVVWGLSALGNPIIVILNSGWRAALQPGLLESVVLIPAGLGLFFGSHGLARIWSRLRYAGLRRQMGLCIHCGYDLTGNTSGICPECGTAQSKNTPLKG